MLILTRRPGESLLIGDEVSVTVLGVRGGQTRLGVDAPRDIEIHREEVAQQHQNSRVTDNEDKSSPDSGELRLTDGAEPGAG